MTSQRMRRSDRTSAVVTGAGGGIGRAFALELARRGGQVLCADVDEASAKETARLAGAASVAWRCDVGDPDQVAALAEAARRHLDRAVDLVVNNAGIGTGGAVVGDTPLADWQQTMRVNFWGVLHGCHEFVPMLRATGGGVINVASAASFAAAPRMGAYNTSKAAVLALSETLAAELHGSGVTVTVLCPTFVRTGILDNELITASAAALADRMMRLSGVGPADVVTDALDTYDRGRLYAVPQWDARLIWRFKRLLPTPYTRLAGLLDRLAGSTTQGG